MFNLHHKADLQEIERFSCALTEANAKLAAISRSMAMIEFSPDGIVLDANENFCKTMGYTASPARPDFGSVCLGLPGSAVGHGVQRGAQFVSPPGGQGAELLGEHRLGGRP